MTNYYSINIIIYFDNTITSASITSSNKQVIIKSFHYFFTQYILMPEMSDYTEVKTGGAIILWLSETEYLLEN